MTPTSFNLISVFLYTEIISHLYREKQPTPEKINLTLAILATRKFDSGSSISRKFSNKYYQAVSSNESMIYNFRKGTQALVIKTFDNRLFVTVDEKIYLLKELDSHHKHSPEFDDPLEYQKKRNHYIPPMSHPWKRKSFEQFLAKQKHRLDSNQNNVNV